VRPADSRPTLAPPAAVQRLRERVAALEEQSPRDSEWLDRQRRLFHLRTNQPPLPGRATPAGTAAFTAAHRPDFYRTTPTGLVVSTLGIGTSRGPADTATDAAYARTVDAALGGGINLIDTSLNYRRQHSERAVNAGVRVFLARASADRAGIVICSKGGYLVRGATPRRLAPDQVVCGVHCLSPPFLDEQLERSRRNLGLQTIDIYYLHNPEVQLRAIARPLFLQRIRAAFAFLEEAVAAGRIGCYGTATWDGLRGGPLSLRELVDAASEVAGDTHHFRFVQLPLNLGMQEARSRQVEARRTVLELATDLGLSVIGSAALRHFDQAAALPITGSLESPAQRALQSVRSTAGITAALVGMRQTRHVVANLALKSVPPTPQQPLDSGFSHRAASRYEP
jgi:aryl-alcohol dehydrogenase-like predicted oxidoreductase